MNEADEGHVALLVVEGNVIRVPVSEQLIQPRRLELRGDLLACRAQQCIADVAETNPCLRLILHWKRLWMDIVPVAR